MSSAGIGRGRRSGPNCAGCRLECGSGGLQAAVPRAAGSKREEYFGLETEPTSTRRSQLKFQLSLARYAAPFEKETSGYWGFVLSLREEELSGSLLGTWAHVANGSSRSRLCQIWLRNAGSSPVGGTLGGQETCDVQTCDEFLKFQLRQNAVAVKVGDWRPGP